MNFSRKFYMVCVGCVQKSDVANPPRGAQENVTRGNGKATPQGVFAKERK